MSELKPCPFCGGTEIRGPEYAAPDHWIECERCEIIITSRERKSAIKLWNRRPIEDALRAERDELQDEVDRLKRIFDRDDTGGEAAIYHEWTGTCNELEICRALCRDMYHAMLEVRLCHESSEMGKRYRGVMGDE